jgi:5'(3')-deoxyribonucleotidase
LNKIKGLAIDFDEVMVETINAVVSILNEDYKLNVNPSDVNSWNFDDVYPNIPLEVINNVFIDKRFFERVKLKPNTIEVLKTINQKYPIMVVTLGQIKNLKLKRNYLREKIENEGIQIKFIGIIEGKETKADIDLNGWLFLDDNQHNLEISNATEKILFENKPNAEWNNHWNGKRIQNITELLEYFE